MVSVTLELVKFTFVKLEDLRSATHVPETMLSYTTLIALERDKPENIPLYALLLEFKNFTFSKVQFINENTLEYPPLL